MATLDEWEARLRPYFARGLRIVAEIPLERADVHDMAAGVRESVRRQGLPAATRTLWGRCPSTMLALMAGFAAHNTEQNYWAAFADFIGVDPPHYLFRYKWHRKFRDETQKRGLRTFDWDEAAKRYVVTIRFHGGIPAYSLPDFFEKIVLPSVERPALREVQPDKALNAVLRTAYFVDSPVIHFLENSGRLGVEMFANCQRLARHYLDTRGEVLPPGEVDLPAYIGEAFAEFMERKDDERLNLRKPLVLIAPNAPGEYLWLKLPEQEIPLRYAAGKVEWRIRAEGRPGEMRLPAKMHRLRQDTLLDEILLPLESAPPALQVRLVSVGDNAAEEVLRSWNIPVLPRAGDAPLLAFLGDGRLVGSRISLPGETLTLLFPADAEPVVEGGRLIENCGQMAAPWNGWQMQVWDLSQAWSVGVARGGGLVGPLVSVRGSHPVPELAGGYVPAYTESPLYLGDPPDLKIPFRDVSNPQAELAKWRIRLTSVWDTWPEVDVDIHLAAYRGAITVADGYAFLPLKALLGDLPVGTFRLNVNGPGDADADFSFRIWPKLIVLSLPKIVVSSGGSDEPVNFLIRLPEEATVVPQAGSGDVTVSQSTAAWQVRAGPEVVRARLHLIYPAPNGKQIRVPVSIPIPRLRRAVTLDNDLSKMEWSTRLVQKSADAYLQSEHSALHVEMFGLGKLSSRAEIQLVSLNDEKTVLQAEKLKSTPFGEDWMRVSLNEFRDTIRQASQQGRFDFVLPTTSGQSEVRIPLAVLSRDFTVKNVRMEPLGPLSWKISWDEEALLRNRRIRIEAPWQPWQSPWEFKIPDSARGEYILENVSLPSMRYHLYFFIAPTWQPEYQYPPADTKPVVIDLATPEQRLAFLEEHVKSHNDDFKALFEVTCIYDALGEREKSDLSLSNMSRAYQKLTDLHILLVFLDWLGKRSYQSPYTRFFYNTAFRKERLEAILEKYPLDHPLLQAYLSLVARAKTIDSESAVLITSKTDDPAVILTCLRHLFVKEDASLIPLLVLLIDTASLSNRDAVDLLAEKPLWAVSGLVKEEPTPTVNRLIAGLLPKLGQNEVPEGFPLTEMILRSLDYIEDEACKGACLDLIFGEEPETGLRTLIQMMKSGFISDEEAEKWLDLYPEMAYEFLKHGPQTEFTQKWIEWIVNRFPHLIGVIRPQMKLRTPMGLAVIDFIHNLDGVRIPQGSLKNRDCRVNILLGEGGERARAWLDLSRGTIRFEHCDKVFSCNFCDYVHPDHNVIIKHLNRKHGGHIHFSKVDAELDIDVDLIYIEE